MKTTFLHQAIPGIAAVWMFVAGCNGGSGMYGSNASTAPVQSAPNTIAITNFTFSPSSMTVSKGTVVKWQNSDGVGHSSTSDNGKWDTGIIPQGGSASVRFDTSGTYTYHCSAHPMMKASITVQ